MIYVTKIGKTVHVKAHNKPSGKWGGPGVPKFPDPQEKDGKEQVAAWEAMMQRRSIEKGSIDIASHERRDPQVSKNKLDQKRMNNSLAARGSKKRVIVGSNGKVKVVTKGKRDDIMFKRKYGVEPKKKRG